MPLSRLLYAILYQSHTGTSHSHFASVIRPTNKGKCALHSTEGKRNRDF